MYIADNTCHARGVYVLSFVQRSTKAESFRSKRTQYLMNYVSLVGMVVKGQGHYYGGPILNRTYGTHKSLYISLVLLTIFGPIYYGPP